MNKIKDITLIAVLTTVLFVQEQLLTNLPGIQLTIFLIVLYSKKIGFSKTAVIVVIHTFLDCLYTSSLSLMYTPAMLIGWLIIPITLNTIFKNVESNVKLAILGFVYSLIYCWLFILPNYILLNIDPITYIISDLLFEIILAVVSFLTILWLYIPCSKIFDVYEKR